MQGGYIFIFRAVLVVGGVILLLLSFGLLIACVQSLKAAIIAVFGSQLSAFVWVAAQIVLIVFQLAAALAVAQLIAPLGIESESPRDH